MYKMHLTCLFHTLSHLTIRQLFYQVFYRVHKPKYVPLKISYIPSLKSVRFIEKYICLDSKANKFEFINLSSHFTSWNETSQGMLWAYNLNYMDWLCQTDISYEDGKYWIDKFITELPQNKIGLDPYPIALRSINWIKFICKYSSQITDDTKKKWNDSLYSQVRFLEKKIEYHLLGNHLLEDLYALFISSVYFKNEKLFNKVSRMLIRELNEEILLDGMHYEQSPMYHCILLDRLLDCVNISSNNKIFKTQDEITSFLQRKVELMLGHLESILYTDESYPLFNDSAKGIAPIPSEIFDYARRLNFKWKPLQLKESGFRKVKTTQLEGFLDVGNITATYQPGHTHADTFTYELRVDGKPLVVDTGISTYNKTSRRQYERSTAAHNTVTVDAKDSSQVWGGFRVGKRAHVRVLEETSNLVKAIHDGFGKTKLHIRTFLWSDKMFTVKDEISAASTAISYIHLTPGLKILSKGGDEFVTERGKIKVFGASHIDIEENQISDRYNSLSTSLVIKIYFSESVTYTITK